jgi:hypothetical protein
MLKLILNKILKQTSHPDFNIASVISSCWWKYCKCIKLILFLWLLENDNWFHKRAKRTQTKPGGGLGPKTIILNFLTSVIFLIVYQEHLLKTMYVLLLIILRTGLKNFINKNWIFSFWIKDCLQSWWLLISWHHWKPKMPS